MGTEPSGAAQPFDRLAARYDAWFDSAEGRPIFDTEVACLADLMSPRSGRWLEVGVGTGRFAQALGVEEGVDPSGPMLAFANRRGISTREGQGEDLPYPDSCFDGVLLVVTLCFLTDPERALRECTRVLQEGGHLFVGFVPSESQWGQFYAHKGGSGHPLYSVARFFRPDQVVEMAQAWARVIVPLLPTRDAGGHLSPTRDRGGSRFPGHGLPQGRPGGGAHCMI
jgi:ubiquinone/menaquinone biosynthesis C-methylase UbiE